MTLITNKLNKRIAVIKFYFKVLNAVSLHLLAHRNGVKAVFILEVPCTEVSVSSVSPLQTLSPKELWHIVHQCYGTELGLTSEDDDYVSPTAEHMNGLLWVHTESNLFMRFYLLNLP